MKVSNFFIKNLLIYIETIGIKNIFLVIFKILLGKNQAFNWIFGGRNKNFIFDSKVTNHDKKIFESISTTLFFEFLVIYPKILKKFKSKYKKTYQKLKKIIFLINNIKKIKKNKNISVLISLFFILINQKSNI